MPKQFEMNADTRLIISSLRDAKMGDKITYATISEALGGKKFDDCRSALHSARRILQRDHDMIFDTIRGFGLARLHDGEIIKSSRRDIDNIRKSARRTAKKQLVANYDKLTREEQMQSTAQLSVIATIDAFTKPSNIKKLAEAAPANTQELPVTKTLQYFMQARNHDTDQSNTLGANDDLAW